MKKFVNVMVSGIAILSLSAFGGGSDGDSGGGSGPATFGSVNVLDLNNGFIIDGRNRAGEDVTLMYCRGGYKYYSGPGFWYGDFGINGDRINMFDQTPTGGSYRIDTYNNYLEVGIEYFIDFQNDEILVENITEDLAC